MKRFQYRLEPVLNYQTQVLDNLKVEHAVIVQRVNRKQNEIEGLNRELVSFGNDFNQTKEAGASIEEFRLFDMCIGRMGEIIREEEERLALLKQKENEKKQEVISAKVDTSKYERMKDKKKDEYLKAEAKAQEQYIEEFVSNSSVAFRHQNRG